MNTQRMAEELATKIQRMVKFGNNELGFYAKLDESECTALIATAMQDAADAVGEWHPIDTAPKDGTRIIVYRHRTYGNPKTVGEDYWFKGNNGWCWAKSNSGSQPTHWMPLPAPPHTPRTAQQSEAVIAKALGKNLAVVKEGSDRG